jgi:hypothetical protein
MKLFALYLLASFAIGIVMWRSPDRSRALMMAALCGMVAFGYYFLRQI